MNLLGYPQTQGTATAAHGDVDKTVVAAQGSGKVLRVISGFVCVHVASIGGAGKVALENGLNGTRLFEVSGAAVGYYAFVFGPMGYGLSDNTLLNLTVDGATTQATATCTVTAIY